ncbi:hypothetical protein EVAR_17715_1 [Eumeta japonica]|uniref:Uncharacterized protein n=1 Tax=Eumeta variegata TaxID=151549 RepID=A0A4C1UT20_EUMVA|nr:hypothetical protein EVAR_17715_1 [Eumeta japonica]
MESEIQNASKKHDETGDVSVSTTSSNQPLSGNLNLPEDTFRMSLDNFSLIGENVTVSDRNFSLDSAGSKIDSGIQITPDVEHSETSPNLDVDRLPIIDTPTQIMPKSSHETNRPTDLLKLSLCKKNEKDVFVKPSPIVEVMSPAKMLQFEIEAKSATPTMKRAAVDFEFYNKKNCDENAEENSNQNEGLNGQSYKETPVIVKPNTVRHEIGYGK